MDSKEQIEFARNWTKNHPLYDEETRAAQEQFANILKNATPEERHALSNAWHTKDDAGMVAILKAIVERTGQPQQPVPPQANPPTRQMEAWVSKNCKFAQAPIDTATVDKDKPLHVCHRCKGEKFVQEKLRHPATSSYQIHTIACPMCDGKGYITQEDLDAERRSWALTPKECLDAGCKEGCPGCPGRSGAANT